MVNDLIFTPDSAKKTCWTGEMLDQELSSPHDALSELLGHINFEKISDFLPWDAVQTQYSRLDT